MYNDLIEKLLAVYALLYMITLTIFIANLDKYLKSHSLMKLLLLIAFQNHRVGIFRKYEVAVRFATSFVKASRSINVQIARMDTWDGMQKRS